MKLGKTCLLRTNNWLHFKKQTCKSTRQQIPVDGFIKKHRKCIKRWKEMKQLKVHNDNGLALAAYATADRYELDRILSAIEAQERYTPCELTNDGPMTTDLCNALHLKSTCLNGIEDSHIFCFDVGTVVMWNLTHGQREEILDFLVHFQVLPYRFGLVRESSELLGYKYAKTKASFLYDNTLYFGVAGENADLIGLNRFLISCAISLSAKVSAFEGMVEGHLNSLENTAARIKAGKDLKMKQKEVLAIAGIACMTKHNLKQSSDSLLIPCQFLEQLDSENELESFANACIYFSLPHRLELFDNNLALCECYANLLLNHFSYRQNLRFQRIILTVLGIGGMSFLYSYYMNQEC